MTSYIAWLKTDQPRQIVSFVRHGLNISKATNKNTRNSLQHYVNWTRNNFEAHLSPYDDFWSTTAAAVRRLFHCTLVSRQNVGAYSVQWAWAYVGPIRIAVFLSRVSIQWRQSAIQFYRFCLFSDRPMPIMCRNEWTNRHGFNYLVGVSL